MVVACGSQCAGRYVWYVASKPLAFVLQSSNRSPLSFNRILPCFERFFSTRPWRGCIDVSGAMWPGQRPHELKISIVMAWFECLCANVGSSRTRKSHPIFPILATLRMMSRHLSSSVDDRYFVRFSPSCKQTNKSGESWYRWRKQTDTKRSCSRKDEFAGWSGSNKNGTRHNFTSKRPERDCACCGLSLPMESMETLPAPYRSMMVASPEEELIFRLRRLHISEEGRRAAAQAAESEPMRVVDIKKKQRQRDLSASRVTAWKRWGKSVMEAAGTQSKPDACDRARKTRFCLEAVFLCRERLAGVFCLTEAPPSFPRRLTPLITRHLTRSFRKRFGIQKITRAAVPLGSKTNVRLVSNKTSHSGPRQTSHSSQSQTPQNPFYPDLSTVDHKYGSSTLSGETTHHPQTSPNHVQGTSSLSPHGNPNEFRAHSSSSLSPNRNPE